MSSVRYALKIGCLNQRLGFVIESDSFVLRSTKHFCTGAPTRKNYEIFYGKIGRDVAGENNQNLPSQGQQTDKFIHTVPTPNPNQNPSLHKSICGKLVPKEETSDFVGSCSAMHLPLPKGLFGINEDLKSKYYEVEEEAIRRPDSDPLTPRMDCLGEGMVTQDEEELTDIETGDTINLPELLFTENRDYLVKYNYDQKVKAEQLVGNVIVILFVTLSGDLYLEEKESITFLTDIYNDLHPKGGFEVVFVAINKFDHVSKNEISIDSHLGNKYFENIFSCMPWCAIPFSDITSRKRLERRFGVTGYSPTSFVVDTKGIVSSCYACCVFREYGTLGYPFSIQRIRSLDSEDDEATKQPSLQTLLGSPERDYLISNKGDRVPIHTLEDKVVALYFYEAGVTDDDLTVKLETIYRELAIKKEKFEVVLLYLYDTHNTFECTDNESFSEKFKTMPWLALPFKDPNHKKLKRIFCYPVDVDSSVKVPTLVTIGPHGEFIDPCGADILRDFELATYPFTRKNLAKLHTEKIKELKLEMLWDQNTVFRRKDGSEVRFSKLTGKRVVTIFHEGELFPELEMLGDSYLDMKGTDDEFEVIHVSLRETELDFDLPWVVHYFGDGYSLPKELLSCVFGFNYCREKKSTSSFLAFDRDGSLVRRKLWPTVEDMDSAFCAGCLEKDALDELNYVYRWSIWDFNICPHWGRIYQGKF